ncbi:MAG: DNA primase large subunit PriL [Thermoplasmata archaeon]|nr:DNA primase large subunit PriL [Thermoplasmata archaeon]
MDSERIAKFPFLEEAAQFVEDSGADIGSLITSPSYEPARSRGVRRVMDALERSEVSYVPMVRASEYDRLMEVLSYPYARMVVSQVGDRFLTKRYALAEAVRMNSILVGEDRSTVVEVSEQLSIPTSADPDGIMRMRFTDYLRLANRLKSVDWKLINSDVHSGMVYLPQDKFSRLMQNALQDKIESELPLMTPEEYRPYLRGDVTAVQMALIETKARFSPTGGEGMKAEYLPPCIRRIMEMSRQGMNLPHSARFALVTYLHALGLSYDEIIRVFAESPDFDESKSEYQIKHITGELSGTDGYSPPECSTMKTNGLCYNPDQLCQQEWMNHPLSYYRSKSGNGRRKPDGDGTKDGNGAGKPKQG